MLLTHLSAEAIGTSKEQSWDLNPGHLGPFNLLPVRSYTGSSVALLLLQGDFGKGHGRSGPSPVSQLQDVGTGATSPLPALTPHPAHFFPQMKFSLEKLHQGIAVSDPPFDSQPRPDDSFS